MDINGDFLSFQDFSEKYNITNFLNYQSLLKAIKTYLKQCDFTIDIIPFQNIEKPKVAFSLKEMLKDDKGCKRIYKIFTKMSIVHPAQSKFEKNKYNISKQEWKQ